MGLVAYTRLFAVNLGKPARAFLRDEAGATALEYAIIATLISVAIVGALTATGTQLNALWTTLANNINPNLAH